MSNQRQQNHPGVKESQHIPTTESPTREAQPSEGVWLASGLLILVLGIGGVLMFSQEGDFQITSVNTTSSDQFSQGFPSTAIASQSTTSELPADPQVLPVSLEQETNANDDGLLAEGVEETVVYFEFDQATLSDKAKALLTASQQTPFDTTQTILVRGHTDQNGSDSYNQALSVRRANAVKTFLVGLGHEAKAIHIEGFGKAQPLCRESTDACAKQNRRANLYFSKKDSVDPTSEPMVSQKTPDSDPNLLASSEAPSGVGNAPSHVSIDTVQLTDSAEEIVQTDPIASITTSQ